MSVDLASLIVDVPDFPTPGISFFDITPLLASAAGFAATIDQLVAAAPPADVVLGIEARGFLLAAPVAYRLGLGVVPVRKPGKLPRPVASVDYALEYRTDTLTMHADAVPTGSRVLIVDDVLATGGTVAATADLVAQLGATVCRRPRAGRAGLPGPPGTAGCARPDRGDLAADPRGTMSSLSGPVRRDSRSRTWTHDVLVTLPLRTASPAIELARRILLALVFLGIVVALVWFDRFSYTDNYDGEVNLIDAIYYATVTISTTGYGDITPVAQHARIINAIVVTPLRIAFLVLLVGTTLEVLANEGRRIINDGRWRKRMRNHVVVVGFGTKGRSAVETLETSGVNPAQIVVIDGRPTAISDANLRGLRRHRGGRDPPRHPAPGGDRQGPRGDHHPGPGRLGDPGHADRPAAQPERPRRGRGAGGRQRLAAAPVRAPTPSSPPPRPSAGCSACRRSAPTWAWSSRTCSPPRRAWRWASGPSPGTKWASRRTRSAGDRVIAVVRNKTLRRFYDPTVAKLEPGRPGRRRAAGRRGNLTRAY